MQRLRTRLRAGVSTFPPATFALNFLTGGLDPAVTFTRGSNATLVDSTGKITYAPANLLLQSQTFEDAIWAKLNGTTTAANTTVAPDGTTTADTIIEAATTNIFGVRQSASLPAGSTAFSIYVKPNGRNWVQLNCAAGGSGSAFFNVSTGVIGTTSGATASISAAENGFYRCTIVVTATAGANTFDLRLASADGVLTYAGNGTSGVFVWGAQLEPVTYQITPSTYVATTSAAYYGPRFDYDPVTLAPKGLLIEEQRVNLRIYSQEFQDVAWTKSRASISTNTVIAPDGTLTADTLVEDTTLNTHRIVQSFSWVSGTAYTVSIFAKKAGRNFIFRADTTSFSANGNATFDLDAGTVSFATPFTAATITNFGDGWYRCTATATANATVTNQNMYIDLIDGANSRTYTGDGTSGLYIWGAQLEAGAFATSYIPTVASTVTRSADVATMTGTNFSSWYNQSEGTFVVNAATMKPSGISATANIFYVNDGTTGNATSLRFGTSNATGLVQTGGVLQSSFAGSAYTANTATRSTIAYKADDFAFAIDGGTVATDTSGAVPTVDRINIGTRNGNLDPINGHIRQIAYYNTRLANATLQAITT